MNTIRKNILKSVLLGLTFFLQSCGAYNFSGADIGTAQSFQVNFFQNYADQTPGSIIVPGLDRDFTLALQDLINDLTSLSLTGSNGDLLYEGEIVEYKVVSHDGHSRPADSTEPPHHERECSVF